MLPSGVVKNGAKLGIKAMPGFDSTNLLLL